MEFITYRLLNGFFKWLSNGIFAQKKKSDDGGDATTAAAAVAVVVYLQPAAGYWIID